jgi:hypothetical protein
MLRARRKIQLDPSLTVKHLKHWTFWEVVKSDFRDRAIPWTLLALRERKLPNDLNTQWSQRCSVILACLALLAAPFWPASVLALALALALNWRLYRFLIRRRGILFGLFSTPFLLFYFLYSGAGFLAACGIWSCLQRRQTFRRGALDGPPPEPAMTPMVSAAPAAVVSSSIASPSLGD